MTLSGKPMSRTRTTQTRVPEDTAAKLAVVVKVMGTTSARYIDALIRAKVDRDYARVTAAARKAKKGSN